MITDEDRRRLTQFVQAQFARENLWCWETIFEEVSQTIGIRLDADRLVYAGGTIRTGSHKFRCNDGKWKEECRQIAASDAGAYAVVCEVIEALGSANAIGVAQEWLKQRSSEASRLPAEVRAVLDALLSWQGYVYRGRGDFSRELSGTTNVIYGLWRVDQEENPIAPLPLNVGETKDTVFGRLSKNHANWWGPKPIGVTLVPVEHNDKARKQLEKLLQDAVIPFANCDRSRLALLIHSWTFSSP